MKFGVCKHCGHAVSLFEYATGPEWMHHEAARTFQDGVYRYCKRTVAEPRGETGE